jgi:molybdate transport system regulatory protein
VKARVKVWVVFGDDVKFGDGRARLLELVDQLGSLRGALARVGMSYRHGWGYFRELERASGIRFLEPAGGGPRGGLRLTRAGRDFVARYRRLQAGLDAVAARRFQRAFPSARRR